MARKDKTPTQEQESTQAQTQEAQASEKPKPAAYEYTRHFLLTDGSETVGDIPTNLGAFRFRDADGAIDIGLDQLGLGLSAPIESAAQKALVWAALYQLNSAMNRVPTASQSEKHAGKTYGELGRKFLNEKIDSIREGDFAGISVGESTVPVFDMVMARWFKIELAEAQRRIDAKRASLSKDAFSAWQKQIRANPEWQAEKARYDLERAQSVQTSTSSASVDF